MPGDQLQAPATGRGAMIVSYYTQSARGRSRPSARLTVEPKLERGAAAEPLFLRNIAGQDSFEALGGSTKEYRCDPLFSIDTFEECKAAAAALGYDASQAIDRSAGTKEEVEQWNSHYMDGCSALWTRTPPRRCLNVP